MAIASLRAAALGAAAALVSQAPAWRLPPLGAAEYRREWRAAAGEPMPSAPAARAGPADGRLPDRYLHRLAPAPWLCQGELGPDQRAIAAPVCDLRDALRWLAFDLGSRGPVRASFPRLLPFGDLVISGTWSAASGDGTQVLRGSIAARPPAALRGEAKDVAERLAAACVRDAAGMVTLTRRIDAAAGVVAAFHGEFDLVVAEDRRAFRRLLVADQWRLVAIREHQDFDFRRRVAAAIAAGAKWVRDAVDERKSFLVDRGGDERNYASGRLALALLAMQHGHVPPDDAVVQRGFAELLKRRIEDSYSLAAALMALAARHAPPGDASTMASGSSPAPALPRLPDAELRAAQQWLDRLLRNVDPRGPASGVLRFNYTPGPRYDTSLQQYGLLGMWSARRCGLDVPGQAFAAAARHLLDVQGPPGEPRALDLLDYAALRAAAGAERPPPPARSRARPRGFAYQDAHEPAFGSMTSAGISGLLLARAGMHAAGHVDLALDERIAAAIRDGFAWLDAEFTVRANPGFADRADRHYYYWLYGLERCCELAGIARLGGRDWYYEGALQLLAQQQPNGSFRAEHPSTLLLDSTCFAVLFLAKATAAAPITGR